MKNVFKEIQGAVIEKFGQNVNATLSIDIYPITNNNGVSIKITMFDLRQDGGQDITNEVFVHAISVETLANSIREAQLL